MQKIGFIGCGNMGGALARAVCKKIAPQQVYLANRTMAKAETLAAAIGCQVATNQSIATDCDVIFLGVKPFLMAEMLGELAPTLAARSDDFVLVSMAAGLTTSRIQEMAGGAYPVIRIMPNTPSSIGAGMIQYCTAGFASAAATQCATDAFCDLLSEAGRLDALDEHLIDAASAVSGSGPAWAYQFIEALADGGVACGLPRAKAMEYAAQMLAGSAQLVLESGQHPGALKDAVCSPNGSTIQGVRVLEERAMRGAVIDAVIATFEKNKEMGKQ
ncbi:MAG: pyrroline-5-carboxylate reductase [Faecalibacterium sp.]